MKDKRFVKKFDKNFIKKIVNRLKFRQKRRWYLITVIGLFAFAVVWSQLSSTAPKIRYGKTFFVYTKNTYSVEYFSTQRWNFLLIIFYNNWSHFCWLIRNPSRAQPKMCLSRFFLTNINIQFHKCVHTILQCSGLV